MSAPERPRVAIIGTGMIAAAHIRAARDAGADVVGILGSNVDSARMAASRWRVPIAFETLDDLIFDAPEVVHVCTPNNTHLDYGLAVVRAGIHVVIEKPVAGTLADARALANAATKARVVATVPYVYRYHPLVREIRQRRIDGEFGEIALIHGSYLQDWLLSADSTTWRIDATVGGRSRAFADIGSHWSDLAEFISGERFVSLTASTSITHASRPVPSGPSFGAARASAERITVQTEDIAVVTFKSQGGVIANTVISQVSAGRKNRLWIEIDGTERSAVFDQENPESIWLGSSAGAQVIRRGEGHVNEDQRRLNLTPPGHPQGWPDAFAAFCADTYAAVRGESPVGLPTIEDGVRSLELIEGLLLSAASGNWEPIHSTGGDDR